jgi:uridine monophosphate synthetase
MGFFSELEKRARQVNSLLCVGLDPHPDDLEENTAQGALAFCRGLIEATAGSALAFKPNAAFFEAYGAQGMTALAEVIGCVPAGIPVILDAKRGDIASTAEAYARVAFNTLGAGAVTASPYLGRDSLEPLLREAGRGVFLLCKTSNPGAVDFQDLRIVNGGYLFERVAQLAQTWNQKDNLGLVVGATQPEALKRVRAFAPELWILAPGIGAQGGDLQAAVRAGVRSDGLGLLLPVSRGISRAPDAALAAEALRVAINEIRGNGKGNGEQGRGERGGRAEAELSPPLAELGDGLLAAGCVQFGDFTLKSGLHSPIYIDLRRLTGYPALLGLAAEAYLPILRGLRFDRLAALPYAAIPIAAVVSLQGGWPMIYPRKEIKEYGTKAEIEGVFSPGERAVMIDDLATTGGSTFEALEKLTAAGLIVEDVAVLIDRQSGAAQGLAEAGLRLHAALTLGQLLDHWERRGETSLDQIQAARRFIAQTTRGE